jgi:hypothetical protein
MTDEELEKKMETLVKGDIINQGQTHFDFRCVQDNIFDKVFRGVYQKEIEHFDIGDIKKEYARSIEKHHPELVFGDRPIFLLFCSSLFSFR